MNRKLKKLHDNSPLSLELAPSPKPLLTTVLSWPPFCCPCSVHLILRYRLDPRPRDSLYASSIPYPDLYIHIYIYTCPYTPVHLLTYLALLLKYERRKKKKKECTYRPSSVRTATLVHAKGLGSSCCTSPQSLSPKPASAASQ